MATKKQDIMSVLDDQTLEIREALKGMTPGSDEFSKAIKDMSQLINSRANYEKVQVQREDNKARLEEQTRMNDEELSLNKARLKIDIDRLEAEQLYKEAQMKTSFVGIFTGAFRDVMVPLLSIFTYSQAFRSAYKAEYTLSDGASSLPPNYIQKSLNDMKPKKQY